MTIEDAIYQILKTNSGVTTLVSGKIFGGILSDTFANYPAIVYRPPPGGGRRRVRTLPGGCTLVRQIIQVFSAGPRFAESATIDYAVLAALDEFRGTVSDGASPEETLDVQSIFVTDVSHEHQYVDKTKLHEFLSEFECHFIDPRLITED